MGRRVRGRLAAAIPAALALSAVFMQAPAAAAQEAGPVAIVADRVVDGVSDRARTEVAVLVSGERIAGVVPLDEIPPEARRIELPGHTLLPGFIDAHTHMTLLLEGDWPNFAVRRSSARSALYGVVAAREMLRAGFTTVRDVGSGGFAALALKQSIEAGEVEGPRMLVSNAGIGTTGGHCDVGGFRPEVGALFERVEEGVADGLDEVRKAVRYQIKYGADLIKICATGGVLSEGDAVGVQQLHRG